MFKVKFFTDFGFALDFCAKHNGTIKAIAPKGIIYSVIYYKVS